MTATPAVAAVSPWPFVRLKLRLIGNNLRGRPVRIVLFLTGVVVAALLAIGGYAIFAVPGVADSARAAGILLPLGGAALVLGWLFLPIVFFGVDESLDPARFALLPLPRRTLITGLFVASMAGLPAVSTLVATGGMVDTAARLGGIGALVAELAGILCGLILCVTLSRAVTSAFATGLRSRRSRELAVVLLAVLASMLGPIQLAAVAAAQRAEWDAIATVARVVGWTPLGAPFTLGLDVVADRAWAVPVKLLIVLVTIVLLLRWWAATVENAMLGGVAAAGGRAAGASGAPVDLLLVRWLPRTAFGALVSRELRYWSRETRRRAALITFTVAGLFLPIPLAMSGGNAGPTVLLIGAIGAVALANQFAYDGSAYAANVIAGVPGRLEVHSRATAHAIFVVPVMVVIAIVVGVVSGDAASIPARFGLLVATYGVGLGMVLPLSVRAAYALPASTSPFAISSGGGAAKGLLTAGVMLGTVIVALPLQILAWTLGGVWPWIGLPAGVAYGAAAYLIGSGIAGDLLDRRMPEVLAAVSGR
ncbi:ABC transporter permease [Actinoplanes sp. TBRC 11911]|uniref:ABC transporter permease n=1 Tax=Actinoplanes sp. TBRC 11911 TaxID=2729386 RepID=UPI002896B0D6|nr:ABC transporter permease [Actinoplanes sp. TBRC 11911]